MLDPTCLAPHAVARWAAVTPAAIALEHVDGTTLTYAELDRRARAWAGALTVAGVAPGDHVATMVPNTADAHLTLLALAWLRTVEVPLNVAFTGRMLAYSLTHADVTTLVVAPELLDAVRDVEADVPGLDRIIVLDDATRAAFDAAEAPTELVGPQYRDVHSLMFTSGTTGPSKAVLTPWAVVYQFWSWIPDDALGVGDGLYCAMPLFHNCGRSAFNYAMVRGGRFVFRDRFSATQFWDDVAQDRLRDRGPGGPDDRVALVGRARRRRRRHAAAQRDPGADDPGDRAVRGPLRRACGDRVRADRDRHGGHHRLGPRAVGRTAVAAARTTRGPRCASSTSTTSRCPPARSASWSCAAPSRGR